MIPNAPAFPWTLKNSVETVSYPGLDCRAYIAAKALEGLCAAHYGEWFRKIIVEVSENNGVDPSKIMATMAVEYADALIDELKALKE